MSFIILSSAHVPILGEVMLTSVVDEPLSEPVTRKSKEFYAHGKKSFNASLWPAKRMRLVHRRKERVLTRSTVPPTIPIDLPN